jgi:ubiquitin carboxyl-terminal hydrolase 47
MATVSDVTVEETAASADDVFQDADPQPDHAHGSVELTAYRINDGERQMVSESSVSFIIKDETSSNWQTSRFNRVLPFSTSIDSLYTLVANDAGYIPGSFNLVWRNQGSGVEEELLLEQHSTATLFEMNMPEEPNKTYLLIKEKNGKEPIKAMKEDKEHSTGQSSNWSSSSQSTNWSASNSGWVSYTNPSYNSSSYSSTNYSVGNYGYGSYSYNSRSDTGHVGLVNQAMTCYLNSLLQTLYMTPEFRNSIYQWKFESKAEDDGMAAKEELARIEASKCIPYQLQRLFLQLQTVRKRAVETTDVTTSFGWDSSEAWQQHDVQELCRVMFDALEKRFKKDQQHQEKTKGDMINELYQGKCKDYVKCKKCGHESARVDTFLDIPLVIKPFGRTEPVGSVEEAIKAFVEPETLEGDNQYFCEKCNEKQDALKGLKFKQFPYLLTLQLKRFDFDYQTLHRIKLNDRMTFPKVLNLNEFIDGDESKPEVPNDVEAKYSDFIVEKFDRTGQPPSYASVISSSSQNFVDGAEEEAVATQDKKSYIIDSFKEGPYVYELFSIMIHSGSAMGGHYYAYIKSFEDKRWYCFNDQSVTRITQEEIEQTFGGMDRNSSRGYYSSMYSYSANAYMLMYRRIDKVNNQVFLTDKEFPDHLKQQIEEEKEREQNEKKKQEMEKQMCRVNITLNDNYDMC